MNRLKQLIKRIDPGYLVVMAIAFLAIWPLLKYASLPQETDAELHIFRLAELSYLIRGGEFYPRWAPNFFHGYGYPIFNYYAPLVYYVALLFELLPWISPVAAVKIVFVLGLLIGAVSSYGFVRDNWGRAGGYVAAGLFVLAPYVMYVDPHARGVLAESFAIGLLPLAFWTLDRLARGWTVWRWITAVFTITAVILSHNLMALLGFGMLGVYVVWRLVMSWRGWSDKIEGRSRAALLVALGLGLGVAAFFWLPVILERNAVNLNTLIGQGDNYDFHTHFLSVWEMLTWSRLLDWGASEPLYYFNLGVPQWLLAGLGVLLWALNRVRQRAHLVYFVVGAAGLIFLMLPASSFVWETMPFLPYFQFPWRMLGAVSVMLAVLGGAGTSGVVGMLSSQKKWAAGVTAVFVALPLLFALPLTQVSPWPEFGDVFTLRMSLIELKGRWLGTTSTADYVPATVDMGPQRNGDVVRGFLTGEPLDRVNHATLPAGTEVISEEISPLHFRYTVDAPIEFPLRLFLFEFPGWQARVDGQPAVKELARPEGFIMVWVPAGEHVVDVNFGTTPARTAAWIVTGVSLLAVVGLAWYWHKGNSSAQSEAEPEPFGLMDWLVLGTVLGITAVTLLILEPTGALHYQSDNYVVELAQEQVFADFGEQIALIGYDTSAKTVQPGDTLNMTLYWQAERPLDINYQNFVHILSADGVLVAQSDHLNPGEFPTRRWPTDKYVRDNHTLVLPPDLAPGEYIVKTGLWVQDEGWRLPLLDETGQQIDDGQILYQLMVVP
ncbi:MAG: hypothetical protein IAF02_20325 [Anaerolineae bacterium]|nr:hypothetical protein [Anaerolineae bacterium]